MKSLVWLLSASLCFGFTTTTSVGATETAGRVDSTSPGPASVELTDTPASVTDAKGACCDDSNVCRILTQQECIDEGSVYQGDGVPCYSNPCQPTVTRELTWGFIKNLYI